MFLLLSLSVCHEKGSLLVFDDGVGMSLVLSTDELCYFVDSPLLVTFHCVLCVCCRTIDQCTLPCHLLLGVLRKLTERSISIIAEAKSIGLYMVT